MQSPTQSPTQPPTQSPTQPPLSPISPCLTPARWPLLALSLFLATTGAIAAPGPTAASPATEPPPHTVCTCEPAPATAPSPPEIAPEPPSTAAIGPQPEAPSPLTLVTPFVRGSGPDHIARTLARHWSQVRHEPVKVINMPERQGRTAARWVAHAPPDGRLLLLTSSTMMDLGPRIPPTRKMAYAPPPLPLKRFEMVAQVGQLPFAIIMRRGLIPAPLRTRTPWAQEALESDNAPPPTEGRQSALSAFARADALSASPADPPEDLRGRTREGVFPEAFRQPDERRRSPWNGLLIPAGTPADITRQLRNEFELLLQAPAVRLSVAQAGTDLWEEAEPDPVVETVPLPPR